MTTKIGRLSIFMICIFSLADNSTATVSSYERNLIASQKANSHGRKIRFSCFFINFAKSHRVSVGWVIDNYGNVIRVSKDSLFKEEDILGQPTIFKIPLDTLRQKYYLAKQITQNNLTKKRVRFDSGSTTFTAYDINPTTQKYRPIFLASYGDVEEINQDANALDLVKWLRTISRRINF